MEEKNLQELMQEYLDLYTMTPEYMDRWVRLEKEAEQFLQNSHTSKDGISINVAMKLLHMKAKLNEYSDAHTERESRKEEIKDTIKEAFEKLQVNRISGPFKIYNEGDQLGPIKQITFEYIDGDINFY